jgi:hypothetical protein
MLPLVLHQSKCCGDHAASLRWLRLARLDEISQGEAPIWLDDDDRQRAIAHGALQLLADLARADIGTCARPRGAKLASDGHTLRHRLWLDSCNHNRWTGCGYGQESARLKGENNTVDADGESDRGR